jgi:hypothetical protein
LGFRSPGGELACSRSNPALGDQPNRAVRLRRILRGVGGGSCEAPPYPDRRCAISHISSLGIEYQKCSYFEIVYQLMTVDLILF